MTDTNILDLMLEKFGHYEDGKRKDTVDPEYAKSVLKKLPEVVRVELLNRAAEVCDTPLLRKFKEAEADLSSIRPDSVREGIEYIVEQGSDRPADRIKIIKELLRDPEGDLNETRIQKGLRRLIDRTLVKEALEAAAETYPIARDTVLEGYRHLIDVWKFSQAVALKEGTKIEPELETKYMQDLYRELVHGPKWRTVWRVGSFHWSDFCRRGGSYHTRINIRVDGVVGIHQLTGISPEIREKDARKFLSKVHQTVHNYHNYVLLDQFAALETALNTQYERIQDIFEIAASRHRVGAMSKLIAKHPDLEEKYPEVKSLELQPV